MSKYINADELKRELEVSGIIQHYGKQINLKIDEMSSADVVEVVRCKDCKFFKWRFCKHPRGLEAPSLSKTSFCSYGERKDDD